MATKKKPTPSKSKAKKAVKTKPAPKKTAKKVVEKKPKTVAPKKVAKKISKPEKKAVKEVKKEKFVAPKVKVEKPKKVVAPKVEKEKVAPKPKKEAKAESPKKEVAPKVKKEEKVKTPKKEVVSKKEETPAPVEENKLDFARVFDVKGGTKLLEGSLNIGGDVKVRRTESFRYEISGMMTDGVTPFLFPFDCNPKSNDGDILWAELIAYEKGLSADGTAKETKLAETPSVTETKKTPEKAVKKEVAPKPIEAPVVAPAPTPIVAQPTPTPVVNNTDAEIAEMQNYANGVEKTIMESFQVRVQGGIARVDVQRLLSASSKGYGYEIKVDQNGKYIVLSKGTNAVRIPKDEASYLPIN